MESPIEWLRINAKQHAAQILQTVKLRVFNPRAVEWQRMHAVAAVFHIEHGHLDPTDKAKHAELISWLARQRHLNGQGLLDPARVSESGALGMIWSKNANAWERGAEYAAAFHRQHGHLAIPATVELDDYAVGAWMRRQRKADNLTKDQVAKLDALDELWRMEPDWNRSYRRLLAYLAAGGTLDGPAGAPGEFPAQSLVNFRIGRSPGLLRPSGCGVRRQGRAGRAFGVTMSSSTGRRRRRRPAAPAMPVSAAPPGQARPRGGGCCRTWSSEQTCPRAAWSSAPLGTSPRARPGVGHDRPQPAGSGVRARRESA
ncbi:helicase associated domain-containing protein [Kitasatospora sp. NPDC056138]|uniref:helicase associated domain-containing protein n=1 Tax=Kitasatospora sp. NPDC056138 TaxID=3345724 RepID=UPI0035D7FF04